MNEKCQEKANNSLSCRKYECMNIKCPEKLTNYLEEWMNKWMSEWMKNHSCSGQFSGLMCRQLASVQTRGMTEGGESAISQIPDSFLRTDWQCLSSGRHGDTSQWKDVNHPRLFMSYFYHSQQLLMRHKLQILQSLHFYRQ